MTRKAARIFPWLIAAWVLALPAAWAGEFDKAVFEESLREANLVPPGVEKLEIGEARPSNVPGLNEVEVTLQGQGGAPLGTQKAYISSDNRYFTMEAFQDMTVRPDQARLEAMDFSRSASQGPKDAKVVVVEFVDFQCPFCRRGFDIQGRLLKDYKGKIRWVYKSLPLGFHPWAEPAARAVECARLQGNKKFWAMHDLFFEKQQEISASPDPQGQIKSLAWKSGLNADSFLSCYDNQVTSSTIRADMLEAQKVGVSGTPGFIVNGHLVFGANEPMLRQVIDEALAGKHGKVSD